MIGARKSRQCRFILAALLTGVSLPAYACTGAVAVCERGSTGSLALIERGVAARVVVEDATDAGVRDAAEDLTRDLAAVGGVSRADDAPVATDLNQPVHVNLGMAIQRLALPGSIEVHGHDRLTSVDPAKTDGAIGRGIDGPRVEPLARDDVVG